MRRSLKQRIVDFWSNHKPCADKWEGLDLETAAILVRVGDVIQVKVGGKDYSHSELCTLANDDEPENIRLAYHSANRYNVSFKDFHNSYGINNVSYRIYHFK